MKRILLILFVLITANTQAQYLKRYGGTGWTNTLHGEWFYNAHPSFGASDSLKIVDYAELWRAINVGGGGGGSVAIGSVVTGATQGSILYAGTGGILQQSNSSLFYDSTNNRVGIGTNTPSSRLDLTTPAIGVTQNNAYGISLVNPDAAAAGAQQMSPGLRLRGNGWKTNATAASQTVDWLIDVLPVQGAASPTSTLQFKSSINGAAYTLPVSFSSSGGISAASASITSNVVAGGILAISTGNLGFSGSSRFNAPSDGILLMIGQSGSGFDRLQFGGTTSSFPSLQRSSANIIARLADNSANTDIEVLDEAYGAGWNGSNEVPTKNAVYDKIETLGGGITALNSQTQSTQTIAVGNGMNVTSGSGTHTISILTTFITSGRYTPTLTGVTNVAGTTTHECTYFRVGNAVTVSGIIEIDPTSSSTLTELRVQLPITSGVDFATIYECSGAGNAISTQGSSGGFTADTTNEEAFFSFVTATDANQSISFSFTYFITPL